MGRKSGIVLTSMQASALHCFSSSVKNVKEHRRVVAVLLRGGGQSADAVARKLGVNSRKVQEWTKAFREKGVAGLRIKKQPGRPPKKASDAKKIIPKLLSSNPMAFGYLKQRWVLRDISRELKKEGVSLHYTSVGRILDDLGIVWKRPQLRAPGSIRKNYRKRREIADYKRVSAALLKKRLGSRSRTKNG